MIKVVAMTSKGRIVKRLTKQEAIQLINDAWDCKYQLTIIRRMYK